MIFLALVKKKCSIEELFSRSLMKQNFFEFKQNGKNISEPLKNKFQKEFSHLREFEQISSLIFEKILINKIKSSGKSSQINLKKILQ